MVGCSFARADYEARRRETLNQGVSDGDAQALATHAVRREQDAKRDATRRAHGREQSTARVHAHQPATMPEAVRVVQQAELEAEEAERQNELHATRGTEQRMEDSNRALEHSRAGLRLMRARAREQSMWNPGSFHRARPDVLDRHRR